MTKDTEKGLGYLIGHKEPEIKVRAEQTPGMYSLDLLTPVDLLTPMVLPEETPKKKPKKERTDKIYKHRLAMQWLTRPPSPYEKATKKKIVEDHYKKAEQPKKKMSIVRYINKINSLYNNSEETPENKYPVKPTERFNDRIQEQDRKQKARNNTTREKTDGQV